MNMLDLATYLPKLGRLTASLANAADEGSRDFYPRKRGKRKPSKLNKKDGTMIIVKKPIVTSHPNAYRSNQWTRSPSPTKKQNVSVEVPKARKTPQPKKNKRLSRSTSRRPEKLIKSPTESSDVNEAKDIRLIQQAIDEFKTQRDQFIHSLGGLQRKLLKIRIPNMFTSTVGLEKLADGANPLTFTQNDKPAEISKEKTRRKKEVRSVSQHFYLADMTESESTTSSSSTSSGGSEGSDTSEIELAKRKVNKFLDYDLIPIQPPDRHPDKANSLMNQRRKTPFKKTPKPVPVKPLNSQLTQLRRGVSEIVKKIPSKMEATKQKAVPEVQRIVESPPKPETWCQPLSPKTRAAVTSEFKKLKKASEMKLRNKLKKTVTNVTST